MQPYGLDSIGYQLHVSTKSWVKKDVLATTFDRVAAMGGQTAITVSFALPFDSLPRFERLTTQTQELDVSMPVSASAEDLRIQAQIYGDYIQVCLESPACTQWINGGLVDSTSWLNANGNHHALLLDDSYNPKIAYHEIRARIKQFHDSL